MTFILGYHAIITVNPADCRVMQRQHGKHMVTHPGEETYSRPRWVLAG